MKIHSQQKHRQHDIFKSRETIFLVTYFETHSFVEVSRLFRERFPGTEPTSKTTIFRNVKNTLIMVRV